MTIALMTLALTLLAAGVVLAAPATADRTPSRMEPSNSAAAPVWTFTITPTLPSTHPVALAISKAFSITYGDVISMHKSGVGFGVIARAYMTAKFSGGLLTPQQVLALHESGVGWGQITKEYGVHPGGKGLGAIMRGHKDTGSLPDKPDNSNRPECPGKSCDPPGQGKPKK
jgi:hypothetical protein